MRKKIVWIIVSCLMVISLVITSCGQGEEEEAKVTEEGGQVITTKEKEKVEKEEEEEVAPGPEVPKYGGKVTLVLPFDITGFDLSHTPTNGATIPYTNDTLLGGDWASGPAGTNDVPWTNAGYYGVKYVRPNLAESWEMPELGTWIFHIRKGVRYALDPNNGASVLMGGREYTADDAVFVFEKACSYPTAFSVLSEHAMAAATTFEAPDKYTLVMKAPKEEAYSAWLLLALGIGTRQMAPEVIQKYGSQTEWKNSVGTGPFILTDFVTGSQATLERNLNYWDEDPCGWGKGNQIPYVDTLKFVIITDMSAQLAAMRAGKCDVSPSWSWDNAASLINTNPELNYIKYQNDQPNIIGMRTDRADLPYSKKEVRQALSMAIDYEEFRTIYGEKSEYIVWPVPRNEGCEDLIDSLDMMPEEVQEIYRYNPERARELLAAAGYPNGFNAKVICVSSAAHIDPLSVVADMWSKVNVNLEIQPMEGAAYTGLSMSRRYEEMCYAMTLGSATYANMPNFRGPSVFNRSLWDDPFGTDPVVEEAFSKIQNLIFVEDEESRQVFRELMPYLLEQVPVIQMPNPSLYRFWQPWVKNYHGEGNIDYCMNTTMKWIWIDQELKESMSK